MNSNFKEQVRRELSRRRGLSPEKYLQELVMHLRVEHGYWSEVMQSGSGEVYWPDGIVLNKTREWIVWYRSMILAACDLHQLTIPGWYYMPVPPEVDPRFVASMATADDRQRARMQTLLSGGEPRRTEQEVQLSFA